MDYSDEIQKILKTKYMYGPKFKMEENLIGINYFSGSERSAFYELYGPSTIYRLIIIKPSDNLFTSFFVGKNYLLLLLLEEEKVQGGFVSLSDDIESEFAKNFDHLPEEQVGEVYNLWETFVAEHYGDLNNIEAK